MYALTVEKTFSAAHAIVIGGERERVHGHNWQVLATVEGESLDAEGLLVDFHALERALGAIVDRFHNGSLNEVEPFTVLNPTAELVAKHIADELGAWLVRTTGDRSAGVGSSGALDSGVRGADNPAGGGDRFVVGGGGEGGVRVRWVRVTGAPGCCAEYRPGRFAES